MDVKDARRKAAIYLRYGSEILLNKHKTLKKYFR